MKEFDGSAGLRNLGITSIDIKDQNVATTCGLGDLRSTLANMVKGEKFSSSGVEHDTKIFHHLSGNVLYLRTVNPNNKMVSKVMAAITFEQGRMFDLNQITKLMGAIQKRETMATMSRKITSRP